MSLRFLFVLSFTPSGTWSTCDLLCEESYNEVRISLPWRLQPGVRVEVQRRYEARRCLHPLQVSPHSTQVACIVAPTARREESLLYPVRSKTDHMSPSLCSVRARLLGRLWASPLQP
ncbi:hypothetical protein LZ30DRAFT_730052 [Colletotrichum cereale]|nr:hypothetical protein LZ30DRAFT_730052 [Colletotrichum cereale]